MTNIASEGQGLVTTDHALTEAVTWAIRPFESSVKPLEAGVASQEEMNNALQALGAFVAPYLDSDP